MIKNTLFFINNPNVIKMKVELTVRQKATLERLQRQSIRYMTGCAACCLFPKAGQKQ